MTDERLIAYWITLAQRRYNANPQMILQTRGEYIEDYVSAREAELEVLRKALKWRRLERFNLRRVMEGKNSENE